MKTLKIISILLICRLVWKWIDLCGADLSLGETLPFCIECSGMATFMRLLLLGIAIWIILRLLRSRPEYTQIYENDAPPGQTFLIHWHRIVVLFALVTYPLWISWVDTNTLIPGPDAVWLTSSSCRYPGFKGTLFWGIELIFIVCGFRVLHKN